MKLRFCPNCKEEKNYKEFNSDVTRKDGMRPYCRKCEAYYQRIYKMSTKYNTTIEEYDKMYEKQNGLCAICGKLPKLGGINGKLQIDHDHTLNKTRGLLCYNCNHGLGCFKDSIELLIKAAEYLL
jgi:hypothetical protein